MLEEPVDIPDAGVERKGLLMEVGKQIIAAVWQTHELPGTQLAVTVNLETSWQLALGCGQVVFIFFDLDSKETDAKGRNGATLFCSLATFDGQHGASNREVTLRREVLRLHLRSADSETPDTVRIGWLIVRRSTPPEDTQGARSR